jgi:hypothetical protein
LLAGCGSATRVPFRVGLVSNADEGSHAASIDALGASIVRVEFSIDAPLASVERVVARYADHGVAVLPLAGFYGRVPTAAEARGLAAWAHALGPGGSFWRHRPDAGALAIHDIEFGNETNRGAQFDGCDYSCPAFAERARGYALALKAAQEAVDGPLGNPHVGLLAIGDDGGTGSANWVDGMFSAVPDLGRRIAGWTAHPYGPHWRQLLDDLVSQTGARGAPSTLPIFITEVGVATDDGRCLEDNLGWNPCMSYAEAAGVMEQTIAGIHSLYEARVPAIFIYQAFDQAPPGSDSQREHYFGVLAANGARKGSYTAAMSALLRGHR